MIKKYVLSRESARLMRYCYIRNGLPYNTLRPDMSHIYQDALRSRRVTPYLYYGGIKTLGLKTGPTNGLVSHSIDVKFYSPPALRQAFGCKDRKIF